MPSTSHPTVAIAAGASAAAGAIHAAAAGSHADMTTLSQVFAVAAVAQIGWHDEPDAGDHVDSPGAAPHDH